MEEDSWLKVPGAGGSATTAIASDGDDDWSDVYICNWTGRGDPDDPDDGGYTADFLFFECRERTSREEPRKKREYRVVVGDGRKRLMNGRWIEALESQSAKHSRGVRIFQGMSQPPRYGETVHMRMRAERRKLERKDDGRWDYGDWEADTKGARVAFHTEFLNGVASKWRSAGAGGGVVGNIRRTERRRGRVEHVYFTVDPQPNFQATEIEADAFGQFPAPDLVFLERASWAMPAGVIRFHVVGGGWFFDNAAKLSVLTRDAYGRNAEANGDITLGQPRVIDGVIEVPVEDRNQDSIDRVAVMVRGAEVVVPPTREGTLMRYAVGGSSTGSGTIWSPPLLCVGPEPEGRPPRKKSSARIDITYQDPDNPGPATVSVGRLVHMARPFEPGRHEGHIDAIVLGESGPGMFRRGSLGVLPLDEFRFVESESTALYVVDDDGTSVDGFEDARIEVTSTGSLYVKLGPRTAPDTKLKLIILNPKLDLGDAPFTPGENARVAIGGDALRGALEFTELLVERHHGNKDDFELLPDEPLIPAELSPIAEVKAD